jgi:hypothetical protein
LIIAFPSFFWLILETSTINSRKLPHYGPKKMLSPGDTQFYKVRDKFMWLMPDYQHKTDIVSLDKKNFPLYAIVFVSEKYRGDAYRLSGLSEYLSYKKDKVEHIPFVIVTPAANGESKPYSELMGLHHSNLTFCQWPQLSYDSLVRTYFAEKPYYIDYSFFVLVDANRNIRGYYDGRYVSEMKRLIEEYKHLRLKEEKQILINDNEIIQNN